MQITFAAVEAVEEVFAGDQVYGIGIKFELVFPGRFRGEQDLETSVGFEFNLRMIDVIAYSFGHLPVGFSSVNSEGEIATVVSFSVDTVCLIASDLGKIVGRIDIVAQELMIARGHGHEYRAERVVEKIEFQRAFCEL